MARTLWATPDRTPTCGCGDFVMVLQLLTEESLPIMHISMDAILWRFNTYYKSHTIDVMLMQHPLLQILLLYGTLFQMTTYLSFHGRFGEHIPIVSYHTYDVSRVIDLGVSAWYADQLGGNSYQCFDGTLHPCSH